MRQLRKTFSAFLAFIISISFLYALPVNQNTVLAYSGSTYTSDATLAQKLSNVFNGNVALFANSSNKYAVGDVINKNTKFYIISGESWSSGYQCYIYANAVYYYLFGDIPYHGSGHSGYFNNSKVVLKNQEKASYQSFVNAGVTCGSYLRSTSNSDGSYNGNDGHSIIILSYDQNGLTYLEGNGDGNGKTLITTRTWSNFNQKRLTDKGRRISHVVVPTNGATPSPNPCNTWINASCGSSIAPGTNVTLTWGADNTASYWLHIWKDGVDYYNEGQSSRTSWSHTFSQTGSYTCYITPYGNYDYVAPEGPNSSVSFTVVEPTAYFDVNFKVNGSEVLDISDIGNIEVYVGGSLIGTGGDFYQAVPVGKSYEVRFNLTNSDYVLNSSARVTGTTSSAGNTVWFELVSAVICPTISDLSITYSGFNYAILEGTITDFGKGYDKIVVMRSVAELYEQYGEMSDLTDYHVTISNNKFSCWIPMDYNTNHYLVLYCKTGSKRIEVASCYYQYSYPEYTSTKTFGNHTYYLFDHKYTFTDAVQFAYNKYGGYLVCINSSKENSELVKMLLDGSSTGYYTGGRLDSTSGNWIWLDNKDESPITYSNWYEGQPDNAGGVQNALVLHSDGWDDDYYDLRNTYGFIVEVENPVPPAPVINTQPENYAGMAGKTAKFTVEAEGTDITYQWQVYKNGVWKNTSLPGNTTDTLSVVIDATRNGMQFRCVVTDVAGQTIESEPVKLTVLAIMISSQPADCLKAAGETATFTVKATGENLTYQWQIFKDGAWKNTSLTGYNTATLSVGVTAARDGMQFRCLIKNTEGKYAISNTATLSVSSFAIKTQPQDYSGFAGETATFKVEAEGEELTYQWQVYKSGAWKNTSLSGYNTDTLEVQLIASRNGMQFRCVVKDANGSKLYSDTATLSLAPLAIISQPEDFEGSVGEKATFKVEAEGEGLTYQWQVYKSEAWKNTSLSGYNTDTLEVEITEARDGMQFRCVVKDSLGNKEITDAAAISIAPITIVEQPEDYEGPAGEYALFAVAAEGEGLTYQWQVYKSGAWKNTSLTGNNTDTLEVEILTSRDGMQFRCVVKDANGNQEITETATLSVLPFSITSEPEDYEGPVGETATFKVETDGEDLKYQWQVYKNEAWKNTSMPGNNTDTLEVEITEARDGMTFRCVITADGYTVVSDEVVIIVKPVTIVITSQPKDFTGTIGETANFEVDAIGEGLTYQWQVYKNGVWKNTSLLGNDGASLLVDAIASRNGMQFRCVITDAEGCTITTDVVTMNVI